MSLSVALLRMSSLPGANIMLKVVLLFCRALCYDNTIVFGFSLFLMWKSLKSHFTLNWSYRLWRHCLVNETIYYLPERSFLLGFSFFFLYHSKITIFISPSKHENIFLNKFTKTRILNDFFLNSCFYPSTRILSKIFFRILLFLIVSP